MEVKELIDQYVDAERELKAQMEFLGVKYQEMGSYLIALMTMGDPDEPVILDAEMVEATQEYRLTVDASDDGGTKLRLERKPV